ncbi:class I SAM-dependent methyltransferase [Pseudomonas sp. Fl4BN1]|uniref:class I SAM-dependent methyltransferase n=1 Tax=Pseudomonas sp. Fl4BN1 TaxID=2697651 RepID=UPI001378E6E4|nr:class I SAM-dependent methyltransferase [Pseudomonas sp. Fl4BN1]NBF12581.1 methyltransferase [Pseudomonas sp. Fl4BN1]
MNTQLSPASTSSLSTPHPMQPYWDLNLAAVQAEALDLALEWQLFEWLVQPANAAEVAAHLQLDPGNTGHWLELLWALQLLERDPGPMPRYWPTALARDYLCSTSSLNCGAAWRFRLRGLRQFAGQLGQQLRSGQPATPLPDPARSVEQWTAAARVQIAQEQQAVTCDVALRLLARIPEMASARQLLDLGGGPGYVALALAREYPQLRATVFDFAPTVAVAAQNIRQAGLEARVGVLGGDLAVDDIGQGYDLIWCSSVLHFVPDLAATLARIHAALRPGGVLVSAHAECPGDTRTAQRVLTYYLSMQMLGRRVSDQGELQEALHASGFRSVETLGEVAFAVAPVTVLVARRGER